MPTIVRPPLERLLDKIEITSSCWLFTGAVKSRTGYGSIWDGSKPVPAHRLAYELMVGPIPDGLDLDHLCRVRSCVNLGDRWAS